MKILAILTFSLLMLGCGSTNIKTFKTFEFSATPYTEANSEQSLNFHGVQLRSGQLLVSDTNTALNFFVTLTDELYHPYAHAGIISIEGGKPYLYHAVAELRLLYKGSLTDKTKGRIRRTPLDKFLGDKSVVAIYDMPSQDIEKSMAEYAIKAHRERLPYDALFDETDSSQAYCSEFIVQAIEYKTSAEVTLRSRNRHPSIDMVYQGLGIDSIRHYFVRDLIKNATRIALFSKTLNAKQIELYFALRQELYRRFTPDQKVGNIMRWTGYGVVFQEPVKAFLDRGIKQEFRQRIEGESTQDWVVALADQVFGELKIPSSQNQ